MGGVVPSPASRDGAGGQTHAGGSGAGRGPREAKRAGIPAWEKEGSDSSLPVPAGQTLPGRDSYAPHSAQAHQQLAAPRRPRLL